MRLILLVVLAAALAAPARAQLFPFSNLHSYFKSVSAGGPGAGADADAGAGAGPEGDAEAAGTAPEAGEARAAEPAAAAAEHVPSQELRPPANHRLHEADAQPAEAAPVVGLLRPASFPSQEAAESGFAGVTAGLGHGHGGNDRVEFQMHGQHGPHTYKWGYDTGKGHNRQFRYEERDAHGHVKGHYGFYDKHGKLQVVSYSADPEHGYHADGNFGKHSIA